MNSFCRNITDYLIDRGLEGGGGGSTTGVKDTDLGFTDKEDVTNSLKNFIEKGSKETLVLTSGKTYKISEIINIDREIEIIGNGATITTDDASKGIKINKEGVKIQGVTFDKVNIHFPANTSCSFNKKVVIENNKFINFPTASAIYCEVSESKCARNVLIDNNTFENNQYSIYGGLKNSIISFNKFTGITGGRNIEMCGGIGNIITNNTIDGGVTGITFLSNKAVTTKLPFKDNYIAYNTIRNIKEESISLDIFGDSATNVGALFTSTITAISSKWVTVDTTFKAYKPLDMYLVNLSGANAGKYTQVINCNTSTTKFEVQDVSNFAVGDSVSLVVPAINNKIVNNTLYKGCIALWGNALDNVIEGNTLNNSYIRVASLYGICTTITCPCYNNNVGYNKVTDGKIEAIAQTFSSASAETSVGNVVKGNSLLNSTLVITNQDSNTDGGNYKLAVQS